MDNGETNTGATSNTNSQHSSTTFENIEKVGRLVNKSIASNSTTPKDNGNSVSQRSSTDLDEIVYLDFSEDCSGIRVTEIIKDSNADGVRENKEVRRAACIMTFLNNIAKVRYWSVETRVTTLLSGNLCHEIFLSATNTTSS
jgi:hypothetical protein